MNRSGFCDIRLARAGFLLQAAFDIPARGVLGIFGNSGSGKTSLLRCIAGLEPDACGTIEIAGNSWLGNGQPALPAHRRNVGFVFQDSRLFPHLDVEGNLRFGMRRRAGDGQGIEWAAVLEMLGISQLCQRYPHELSGGEQQRVAIARALMSNPKLLLLDEPMASLDEQRKAEIMPFLERLHDELAIPMLYISHSIDEVVRLCDQVLVLEQGRKRYIGEVHQALTSPEAPFLQMESSAVLLDGTVERTDSSFSLSEVRLPQGGLVFVPGLLTPGRQIRLRVVASNVSLCRTPPEASTILNILPAEIVDIQPAGNGQVVVALTVYGQTVLSRISQKSLASLGLARGQQVYAQIKAVSLCNR